MIHQANPLSTWVLTAAAVIAGAFSVPAEGGTLFGLSSSAPGTLYTLDPNTGVATPVTNLTGTIAVNLTGLSFLGSRFGEARRRSGRR